VGEGGVNWGIGKGSGIEEKCGGREGQEHVWWVMVKQPIARREATTGKLAVSSSRAGNVR
jgi:hypothetical protein